MSLCQAVRARDENQGALPEFLLLVVLHKAGAQISRLTDVNLPLCAVFCLAKQEVERDLIALRHFQELGQ